MKTKLLLLMMLLIAGIAKAQQVIVDRITYGLNTDKTAYVMLCPPNKTGEVVIPENITSEGVTYKVTMVESKAFKKCNYLISILLPNGVTTIGAEAFNECTALISVNIPNGVTSIQFATFQECNSLATLNIPDGVTRIDPFAFNGCKSLTVLDIPDSVTKIGKCAFQLCIGLTTLKIPDGVTRIEAYTFASCTGLKSVHIPNNVTFIGENAFTVCSSLTSFEFPNGITQIPRSIFYSCTNLISVKIPHSVSLIENGVFEKCTSLAKIYCMAKYPPNTRQFQLQENNITLYIPTGSKVAYQSAEYWKDFTDIQEMEFPLPQEVYIGEFTYRLNKDTKATLTRCLKNNRTNSIDAKLLSGTDDLFVPSSFTYADITFSVDTIGSNAFSGYSNLTSIELPSTISVISDSAFRNCSNLNYINIPNKLTTIGDKAFEGCTSLTSVNIPANTILGEYAFKNSGLTSVTLPGNITALANGLFNGCGNLTTVNIPASVFTIGNDVFSKCVKLKTISLPVNLITIGSKTFESCIALESIEIPAGVTTIGESAFNQCTALKVIRCKVQTPPSIVETTFNPTSATTLYVPIGCKDKYQAAEYWKNFTDMQETDFTSISTLLKEHAVYYADGWLTLPDSQSTAEIIIYTPAGTRAGNYILEPGKACDLSYLPSGVFIIYIESGAGRTSMKIIR